MVQKFVGRFANFALSEAAFSLGLADFEVGRSFGPVEGDMVSAELFLPVRAVEVRAENVRLGGMERASKLFETPRS
ncbi:hypothetical protein SFOMI_3341 [Sphingobium fuliginis]|uniref:Uncharacterized protein n=1 Tax=Sphingobium fuliginis (strain ATCC 27551) TaxID=336203 RepID=A0A292ZIV7_SPHSA|nr:hypothetical protein SFOMI_3341 [Sphingobium fuliginis]